MTEQIISYLKETYNPDAIILHGSRARGAERTHSDWDFVFLYENENQPTASGRELYLEQNLEYESVTLPVSDPLKEFGAKLQSAQVLFETNGQATDLLRQIEKAYKEPLVWSEEDNRNHQLWFQGRIDGMRDNVDRPMLFSKYYSDVYLRVFNYWYWIKQETHSQPIYIAIEDIQREDVEYFNLVEELQSATAAEQKVLTVEQIRDYLFRQ